MTRQYEYKVVFIELANVEQVDRLNQLGKEGWILVHADQEEPPMLHTCVFLREKSIEEIDLPTETVKATASFPSKADSGTWTDSSVSVWGDAVRQVDLFAPPISRSDDFLEVIAPCIEEGGSVDIKIHDSYVNVIVRRLDELDIDIMARFLTKDEDFRDVLARALSPLKEMKDE